MLTSQRNAIAGNLIRGQITGGVVFRFRVVSDSMAPVIRVGDEVVIGKAVADELRRGDIVLYAMGDAFHTHRLLSIQRQAGATLLVTKGDNALSPDQPWREEELLGKVVAIDRGGRTIDLEGRRWRAINRLLGILSRAEAAVFQNGRFLKRTILGERKAWLTPVVVEVIRAPFRLCVRLVAGLK